MRKHSGHEITHVRAQSRRRLLKGAAAAGAGALGLVVFDQLPLGAHSDAHAAPGHDESGQALRDAMRKLWEDHIVWTRGFIVSFAAELPDLDATTQRLLGNQADIGNAVKPFVGNQAGDHLAELLTQHILGAAQLLSAAKAGDSAGIEQANTAWYANADEIAAFLAEINPRGWRLSDLQAMMREHLDLTLEEAGAQLQGNWAASIAAYDHVHDAILHMADMLSDGLTRRKRH